MCSTPDIPQPKKETPPVILSRNEVNGATGSAAGRRRRSATRMDLNDGTRRTGLRIPDDG